MLNASARTHAGRVRAVNEDAAVCRPERGLFAVIDGMGGQEAGEIAAAIAAAAIAEVPDHRRLPSETVLSAAFKEARKRILHHGEQEPAHKNLGAVATAVRFEDNGRAVGIAHVGDSRAWLVNAKGIRQLTHDHAAPAEVGKARVTRDLGRAEMPAEWVETARVPVAVGDLLVLASDGLHDAVPEGELAETLTRLWREKLDADAVSARLVALALARGGPDNVTVVAVRVGRFSRGRLRQRLPFVVSVGLFAVMIGLVGVALSRRPIPAGPLPDRVAEPTVLQGVDLPVPAGQLTTVAAGASLTLRGVRVTGPDWNVHVGEGATLRIELSAVELTDSLAVLLADGAALEVVDARLEAPAVKIAGTPTTRFVFRDATVCASGADGVDFEGALPFGEDLDARFLGQRDCGPAAAAGATPAGVAPAGTAPAEGTPPVEAPAAPAPGTPAAPAAPAGGPAPR